MEPLNRLEVLKALCKHSVSYQVEAKIHLTLVNKYQVLKMRGKEVRDVFSASIASATNLQVI